jgi:hypothetical protein
MSTTNSPSPAISGSNTPNPTSSRFTSQNTAQNATAEDLLKAQTEGLVSLSDYKKRRLEAIEQKEIGRLGTPASGASTPGYVTLQSQTRGELMVEVQVVDSQSTAEEEAKEECCKG